MPGPGHEVVGEEELSELQDLLKSGYFFRYGNLNDARFRHKVYSLEAEFSRYCGVQHALAVASGTAALLVALKSIGLQPGDEVIVPAYTFVATFSSVIFAGGVPILTEIDESLNMDPAKLESRITSRTRAIIPVHMLGNPCDMDSIMAIAKRRDLKVIEDACQANGGSYHGSKLGSLGNLGAFSLNIFKTISAGDGGLLITDDRECYETAFAFHDQGHFPQRAGVEVGRRHILGMNFRMNELTGAVALAQLRKLDQIVSKLRANKKLFKSLLLADSGFRFRTLNDSDGECATLCTVIFDSREQAARVSELLKTKTVDQSGWHVYANMEHVNQHLKEIGQPYGKGAYPETDDILSRSINLSVGVVDEGLGSGFGINLRSSPEEIERTAEKFNQACSSTS